MSSLQIQDLLLKKRDGGELTAEELDWFCKNVAHGRLEECQIGAMLMAMAIRGLTDQEVKCFTKAIINSGESLTWDPSWGPPVDKHSTGGVGDKVSIILAPALASFGLKVPMLSGRGLGHTGGTLDKLESIPGFTVQCSREQLQKALSQAGCFIAGASSNVTPADRILYGIRDITSTVDIIPLVVASIVSKKVAAGSKLLVMDIKVGSAAFFKTKEEAERIAKEIIKVSKEFGVTTRAVLTKMENPIGKGIGNALEIEESVTCMKGYGEPNLIELVAVTGGLILQERGIVPDLEKGKAAIIETLENGKALESFKNMLVCQGVSQEKADELCQGHMSNVLPSVPPSNITPMKVMKKGVITNIKALELGTAVWRLGAGRVNPDQAVDYRVGIWLTHAVGDEVDIDDVWAEVHHADNELSPQIQKQIEEAIIIEEGGKPDVETLVIEII